MGKEIKCVSCKEKKIYYSQKMCRSCYEKDLRKRNPEFAEKQRKNSRGWRKSFPEKKRASDKKWIRENIEKVRVTRWCSRTGITLEDYELMLKNQNHRCAICRKHSSKEKNKFAVDHDHKTGKIRGLLCFRCNFGLGWFQDDLSRMKKAVEHLEGKNSIIKKKRSKIRKACSKRVHIGFQGENNGKKKIKE